MFVKIECPNCGANMEVEEGRERLHCKYCGFEIVNLTDKKEITQNINVSGTVRRVYTKEKPEATKKEPGGSWKKLLGKGAFVVACIVIAVVLLGVAAYVTLRTMRTCRSGNTTVQATPTPEPTPVPGHRVFNRKMDEAPPLELLGLSEGHLEEYSADLMLAENWLDMTKDGTEGFRIIRSVVLGCSYLVQDGNYYRLGEGEDGKGLLDYYVTDLDYDDEPDLIYTYHFGANEDNFTKVGWFNLTTHENVLSDFSQRNGYLALIEEDGNFILCRADRLVDEDTLSFGLTVTERLGEITETMGRIVLILDAQPTPEPVPEP